MVQQNILNPVLERRGLETKGPDFAEEKFQFEMSPSQKKVLGLKTADIKAVTFDKPEFDMFVDLFSQRDEMGRALYPEGPSYIIAREVANQLSTEFPELISFQGLIDGTAPFFDQYAETVDQTPQQRKLNPTQILQIFAEDTQGNRLGLDPKLQGFKKEAIPTTLSGIGLLSGGKTATRLLQPLAIHPLAKATLAGLGGISGAILGYKGGEEINEAVLDPETPILPAHRVAYEKARTATTMFNPISLTTPFLISKNVDLGTAKYLKNLALAEGAKSPFTVRFVQGIERMLSGGKKFAMKNPAQTLGLEGIFGFGATKGAELAETTAPGDALTRLGYETVGGIGSVALVQPLYSLLTNSNKILSATKRKLRDEGLSSVLNPLKQRRMRSSINSMIKLLEQNEISLRDATRKALFTKVNENGDTVPIPENELSSEQLSRLNQEMADSKQRVADVIEALEAPDFIDPETGKRIQLTAGAKTGNPVIIGIQSALDRLGGDLGAETKAGATAANDAIMKIIGKLINTKDQRLLQTAADMSYDIFAADFQKGIAGRTKKLLDSFQKLETNAPNSVLSQKMADVLEEFLFQARLKEKKYWSGVENMPLLTFKDSKGKRTNVPTFIQKWNNLTSVPEVKKEYSKSFPFIAEFVERKFKELGLDPEDLPDELRPVTSEELVKIRSLVLDKSRSFMSMGERDKARVGYDFAQSLLEDLNSGTSRKGFKKGYDIARAYSKALNDVFTRAFTGKALARDKFGGEVTPPELLAEKLLRGGSDTIFLRMEQIFDVGKFAKKQKLEGYKENIGTVRSVLESILRNARATDNMFKKDADGNPTGEVNASTLSNWMKRNDAILGQFPALKKDLTDIRKASLLLDEDTKLFQKRMKEEKDQKVLFYLMNPRRDEILDISVGSESPTQAISFALRKGSDNKTPMGNLNKIKQIIMNGPEDLKQSALEGYKSSLLEWAYTGGGLQSGTADPVTIYRSLFVDTRGKPGEKVSISDWMIANDLASEAEMNNLQELLKTMVRFQGAQATGTLDQIIDQAGPVMDFFLAITGSAVGTRSQALFTGGGGPGALVAAGKGAETMRRIFDQMPAALQTDLMSEVMKNPQLLASLLKKGRTEAEKIRINGNLINQLTEMGFIKPFILDPTIRETIPTIRETEEEKLTLPEPTPPVEQKAPVQTPYGQINLSQVNPPASFPTPTPQAQAQPSSGSADPNTRTRYASLFPDDPISGMLGSGGITNVRTT